MILMASARRDSLYHELTDAEKLKCTRREVEIQKRELQEEERNCLLLGVQEGSKVVQRRFWARVNQRRLLLWHRACFGL